MRIPTFSHFVRQANQMSKQYQQLGQLQVQAETGKKIQRASEDPVLAKQIKAKEDVLRLMKNYDTNGVLAKNRSELFNSSIQNTVNLISQVNDYVKKAQNGTLNDRDRSVIAQQLQGMLTSLQKIANTEDGNGEYIFSGMHAGSPAYVQINGRYQYLGSYTATTVNLAPDVSVPYTENGFDVFGNIFQGNGKFVVSSGAMNTGAASTSPGVISNQAAYLPDTYTITFVTNGLGQLAYQVTGSASGQVIPAPPATIPADAPAFVAGQPVEFNGVTLDILGQPNVGDSFDVQPSTKENIFNTIQDVISELNQPVTNQAKFDQFMSQAAATLGQAMEHVIGCQTKYGSISAAVDAQIKSNNEFVTNQMVALSDLSNVDLPSIYSAIAQQSLMLQATQESYMKMQDVLTKLLQMQF